MEDVKVDFFFIILASGIISIIIFREKKNSRPKQHEMSVTEFLGKLGN